jgi:hypothetical protein
VLTFAGACRRRVAARTADTAKQQRKEEQDGDEPAEQA